MIKIMEIQYEDVLDMEKKSKIKKYRGCLIRIEDLKIFKQSIKYSWRLKDKFSEEMMKLAANNVEQSKHLK